MAENTFTLLIVLGLVLWLRETPWAAFGAGAVLGAAALTRAPGLAVLVALVLVSGMRLLVARERVGGRTADWRRAAARLVLCAVGGAVVLAPWTIRNYQLFGRLVITDTPSGYNFLLGNNPFATGRLEFATLTGVTARYWTPAPDEIGRSQSGYREGLRFIQRHPGRAAVLALRKLAYLVGLEGREHAWGYSHGVLGTRSPVAVWGWGLALLMSFPLLMLAALPALLAPLFLRERLGQGMVAILAGGMLVHMASFGESRFHLPWIPPLAVAAAWTVVSVSRGGAGGPIPSTRRRRLLLGVLAVGLLIAWASQIGELGGRLSTISGMGKTLTPLPYLSRGSGPRKSAHQLVSCSAVGV